MYGLSLRLKEDKSSYTVTVKEYIRGSWVLGVKKYEEKGDFERFMIKAEREFRIKVLKVEKRVIKYESWE